MLDFIRKRAKSWAIRILLFAVAATFVLWGVGGFVSEDLSAVITVDGDKIPYSDYLRTRDRLVESYRTVMGGALDAKAIRDLKVNESAVDFLLERALLTRTARELNMTVGSSEIRAFIEREPSFNDKGIFSRQRYQEFLSSNNLSSESFEASLANDMTLAKVRSFLRASAAVSPQEIEEILDMSARKVEVKVAKLDPDRFVRLVPTPTAAELSAYFEEHREEFRRPESFQAAFAVIDPASYRARATAADDELAALYEEKRAEMTEPASYRFSRVLFALPASAASESVAAVRARADATVKEIRDGKLAFAAAAARYSQDRATAAKGGAVGLKTSSDLEPAVAAALETAEKGKVTDPVPTARGLELLLLEAKTASRTLSLAEARERLTAEVVARKALDLANDAANKVLSAAVGGKTTLAEAGRAAGAEVHTPPAFSRKVAPAGLAVPADMLNEIYRAETLEVGNVYEMDGKLLLFQMVKRTDAYVPQLAEARADVEAAVLVGKAMEMTDKEGERLAKEISSGAATFAAVASRVQAKVLAPAPFSIIEKKVGDLPEGDSAQIVHAAFTIARPGGAALARGKGSYYLVGLAAALPADARQKDVLRPQVTKLLHDQRAQQVSAGYFGALREEMKDRIKINSERL